jgi:hypothetical protein
VEITFTDALDAMNAADVKNYEIKVWGLTRSKNYGSKHVDERMLPVAKGSLLPDGKTVRLAIAELAPTWGMEIKYRLKGTDGRAVVGVIHNTIHALEGETAPPVKQVPANKKPTPSKPTSHTERKLEGWTIRVDDRLLTGPHGPLGNQALRFLESKLSDIKAVVPKDKLTKLQAVVIVLDLTHGNLGPMQYHPSAGWLKANGYSADLAKCVHLPRAADLPTKRNINEQPWVILHELAHAYHDQVLGFDEPRIREAYERYKKSGRGDKTLLYNGKRVKHYALTNEKEFFAEMTEA